MSTLTLDEITQRRDALGRANEIRFARARLKERIHGMSRAEALETVARLVDRPAGSLESMRVETLLLAVPRLGQVKVGRLMRECNLALSMRLGDLSRYQAARLVSELRRLAASAEAGS